MIELNECNSQILDGVYQAIEAAADTFEKQHGYLNESSDFELYGKRLEDAVIEYNKLNGTDLEPSFVLNQWSDHCQKCYDEFLENDEMSIMIEALANWDKLKAALK